MARAFAREGSLIILDEPFSGLDPINAELLLDTVGEQQRRGATVVFCTHLMDSAERLCDEVTILAHGRAVLAGPVAELKRNATKDRSVALTFADLDARELARRVLDDDSLVARCAVDRHTTTAELAEGRQPEQLLRALVQNDVSLRRFEVVEPTLEETVEILRGLQSRYEEHHKISYEDEAVEACAKLADRHVTDRRNPDKAIDVLDEVGAAAHLAEIPQVDLRQVESKTTGVRPLACGHR